MQQTDPTQAAAHDTASQEAAPTQPAPVPSFPIRRRLIYVALVLLVILALVFGPPLVNVSRFQRRIATSISNSIGRPVHLDRVSLNLLPLPGFTIENLVVGEDSDFGSEPIIRANLVHATLRISSLWRRQVEFSTISFTEPSVNLVHNPDGRWNIEGILLQASRIDAAPTAQRKAGPAPRFPYIEATGARLNFKQEQEKLPFSLVDSEFALWLPDPHQWHFRLKARPTRTDVSLSSDTGTIEFESTLSAATSSSQIPINLQGQWRNAPLGEATRVVFGHDAGWRGEMTISANIRGTLGDSAVTARLRLSDTRRADFVPDQTLNGEAECFATATHVFHTFDDLRCSWPPATSSGTPAIALTGSIPNVLEPRNSRLQVGTSGLPASTLVSWLRVAIPGVPASLAATGTLSGSLSYEGAWQGELALRDAGLTTAETGQDSLLSGNILLRSASRVPETRPRHHASLSPIQNTSGFQIASTTLALGGREPATIDGHIDGQGYTLHLTGSATGSRLDALTRAIPALGEGLAQALPTERPADPFHIDATATRAWGSPQTWHEASVHPPQSPNKPRRR
jgi:AsmA protein